MTASLITRHAFEQEFATIQKIAVGVIADCLNNDREFSVVCTWQGHREHIARQVLHRVPSLAGKIYQLVREKQYADATAASLQALRDEQERDPLLFSTANVSPAEATAWVMHHRPGGDAASVKASCSRVDALELWCVKYSTQHALAEAGHDVAKLEEQITRRLRA
jgi:hypothetical protein